MTPFMSRYRVAKEGPENQTGASEAEEDTDLSKLGKIKGVRSRALEPNATRQSRRKRKVTETQSET